MREMYSFNSEAVKDLLPLNLMDFTSRFSWVNPFKQISNNNMSAQPAFKRYQLSSLKDRKIEVCGLISIRLF